jgi:hypothetical protein
MKYVALVVLCVLALVGCQKEDVPPPLIEKTEPTVNQEVIDNLTVEKTTAPTTTVPAQQGPVVLDIPQTPKMAENNCKNWCKSYKLNYTLDSQCLGNLDNYWVCDIAHNPRTLADDEKENTCPDYMKGSHNRFVEVDQNCDVIRSG